ncbi:hypothetical protein EVAR_32478_1 [Eumeta japonica]|uniref:Uncharacterized protein n=1 Tax=Eumeta variegata TaxID=151549 RepID=A0A4C1VNU9_EUMVA|nr:hypothetical protein EVAR_32478_1 [Eumeta japonica]
MRALSLWRAPSPSPAPPRPGSAGARPLRCAPAHARLRNEIGTSMCRGGEARDAAAAAPSPRAPRLLHVLMSCT